MGRLDVDSYLAWRFDRERRHCWHLARAAWLELTGQDIGAGEPEGTAYATLACKFAAGAPGFRALDRPSDPCLVLMRRPRVVPHVGVYYRGRVLQLRERGASYMALGPATAGFQEIGFYR